MIYESYTWKQDLLKWKRTIQKNNKPELLALDNDKAFAKIEKSIFYSAFVIRKLIDCKDKVSDAVDQYKLEVDAYKTKKKIDLLHWFLDEESHEWKHKQIVAIAGKTICNFLIHSYVFCFDVDDNNSIIGFFLASDLYKDRILYYVKLKSWMAYMDFVWKDDIALIEYAKDINKGDFICIKKVRNSDCRH